MVEVAAERNVNEPQIIKLLITIRNRRHFALRLYEVELVQPRKGVTLFSHHPNSAGGVQRREHRIFMVTRRVEPGSFGNASIFVVLDDDVKEYIGPLRLAIKTSSGSGTVRHYTTTIRRDVELRAP